MPKIHQIFERLMSQGTTPPETDNLPSWTNCPFWPPDLFAVAATLVELSGCYSRPEFSVSCSNNFKFSPSYISAVEKIGMEWATTGKAPQKLANLWKNLVKHSNESITDKIWYETALKLMAIADVASIGIGFNTSIKPFPVFFRKEHEKMLKLIAKGKPYNGPLYIPESACILVDPEEACVQPKTITPQVGCTLRSLSHNLALLPSRNTVSTSWLFATGKEDENAPENRPFNVLLIPFPFHINGMCFIPQESISATTGSGAQHHYFEVKQEWLVFKNKKIKSSEFIKLLIDPLLEQARLEVGEVHGIIFPELALNSKIVDDIAIHLAKNSEVEILVAGIAAMDKRSNIPKNVAVTYRLYKNKILTSWKQSKHHRWCLDQTQIQRYHLGHNLQPKNSKWWEKIDVSQRTCTFNVVRHGTTMAVMVCEDLARFDPVHPVVRSVGTNLVIALLMDGPQLKERWPSQYATVLADDPGCAVLTFTCLGMVLRSFRPGSEQPRGIALWKQPGGNVEELKLPFNHQGLLLTLSMHKDKQFTLDGRSDNYTTSRFELSGVRGVKLSDPDVTLAKNGGLLL